MLTIDFANVLTVVQHFISEIRKTQKNNNLFEIILPSPSQHFLVMITWVNFIFSDFITGFILTRNKKQITKMDILKASFRKYLQNL